MKITEILSEAKASRLPGAPAGIEIMSPEEFVKTHSSEELDEAGGEDLLGAPASQLTGKDFQDYMRKIATDTKSKSDKYKMPYIHRKSVRTRYYDENGDEYDEAKMIEDLMMRPKKLLKQNEKMEHSNGEKEQYYNIGLAALRGIAVDERGKPVPIIVNTCPGAGDCQIKCFARKGSAVQFEPGWLSAGRVLTYLINDPEGFKSQIMAEIANRRNRLAKHGIKVVIRWHDSGDFFSPAYINFAFSIAKEFPDVDFYAYTKMAAAALAVKPKNFIINWSEGATSAQKKQINMVDPELQKLKNSRIVPPSLYRDLLKLDADGNLWKTADVYEVDPVTGKPARDEKGKLVKSEEGGAWQWKDSKAIQTLKARLTQAYGLKPGSVITNDEMLAIPRKNNIRKWNVIVAPGEGDTCAKRHDVLTALLIQH